jgi:hypothetical protein
MSVRNAAGLVEVTGRVGPDWLLHADVVLAIDRSNSSLKASGIDLDGDGRVGSTYRFARDDKLAAGRHWRSWTSDPDDAMVWVELEAARNLIRSLDSAHTRIGVLTYTDKTRTRALLGSPLSALQSLDTIVVSEEPEGTTDVARALRGARDLFLAAPHLDEPDRPRVVFLFSDGRPNVYPGAPSGKSARYWAKQAAIQEAEALTERQIAVCTLGFGEGILSKDPDKREEDDIAFLDNLARATGCVHIPIDDPGVLRFDRAPRFASPTDFELRNLTTGRPGRALRVLESGLFDGFVELAPGENTLEVSARLAEGQRLVERRVVYYEPGEAEGEEEREATARLLLRLRERTRQLEPEPAAEPSLPPVGSSPPQ